jgi:hypothetical protein
MKKMMNEVKNTVAQGINSMRNKAVTAIVKGMRSLHQDERGVDIIVMVIVLAILVGFAMLFKDTMATYLNKLFTEILVF